MAIILLFVNHGKNMLFKNKYIHMGPIKNHITAQYQWPNTELST